MNVLSKLMTALRGGVNEAGEAIIDTQALRILDQELRDAAEELKRSKASLAEIIAHQKVAEEKAQQLDEKISEYEGHALKALEKKEEALALEVAQKIADLESQKEQESLSGQSYETSAVSLRKVIRQTEQNLKRIKHQVDTVKATESVQRAQAAVAEKHSGTDSKMRTAMDSLERIKEKQSLKAAQMSAAQEIAEDDVDANLQDKLERAGIRSSENSAEDVLARLKKK